jgi:hypothetical protein
MQLLPIAILTTLSLVADTVPKFDMTRECRLEGFDVDRCSRDEADALHQLKKEWSQFASTDKKTCMGETTIGGFASYVELLTCLEMARDSENADNSLGPRARNKLQPMRPRPPGVSLGEGHDGTPGTTAPSSEVW